MTITNFLFNDFEIMTSIDNNLNIWFKGVDVATALGYTNARRAIRKHVDTDDKKWGTILVRQKNCIIINESGLYSLVLRSKLDNAKVFKKWITSEVLPNIRKTGTYKIHSTKQNTVFSIESEFDLHSNVITFIKRFYPHCLLLVANGELQNDTIQKRIKSFKTGYESGTFDLIIKNLHKKYNGMAIEFKTPNGLGIISQNQIDMENKYKMNDFKTLISNDYNEIIFQIIEYMNDVRINCNHCKMKFKSVNTLNNHHKFFHRIN